MEVPGDGIRQLQLCLWLSVSIALPKHGDCRAAYSLQIEEGHFGAVRLDGLRAVGLLSFPGAVH